MNGAGLWESPMITVPEPPITTSPCVPTVPTRAAFLPLMNTVADTAESKALPQVQVSPFLAAARPSKNTSGDPDAMALGPCPGIGQLVGSVMRAAGFAMYDFLSTIFPRATVSELRRAVAQGIAQVGISAIALERLWLYRGR